MTIRNNAVVTIDYTIKDAEGTLLEESDDGPLSIIQGLGDLAPGLEKALEGKKAGDEITVTLPPEEAFGEREEDLMITVSMEDFEDSSSVEEGFVFHAEFNGEPMLCTVLSVDGDKVVIDGNHPFAGLELTFEVNVRDVREATPEELDHGHVHDEHGHHHNH